MPEEFNENKFNIQRQAVLVIHGMGEQKPMDTLREFVESIAPEIPHSKKQKFFNKPDVLSETFELRRLTANEHRFTFKTDYFEYYWAHKMSGTKLMDVLWWFWTILLRRPKNIPDRLRWIYWFFWVSIFMSLLFILSYPLMKEDKCPENLIKNIYDYDFVKTHFCCYLKFVGKYLGSLTWLGINFFLIYYLGDVVRYTTPRAGNIKERQDIRETGIELLRKLHDAKIDVRNKDGSTYKRNKYDRIIVVGHSLGAVVAYDLIKFLWIKHNGTIKLTDTQLTEIEDAAYNLSKNPTAKNRDTFREIQLKLWKSQFNRLDSWRVSDFITLGSPLAHAKLLLAGNPEELVKKQAEREYPTCPPTPEGEKTFHFPISEVNFLHHAAPFALTRWTNITFEKDFVGGNNHVFGHGVENHFLRTKSKTGNIIPFWSHIGYWNKKEKEMINLIRKKMQLRIPTPQDKSEVN
ncbi:hypothetical protein [Emticicia sp. BO119]|uniref:hypothetical protein n=1 Tax=Emticicia sp. BO119 TaxID=2757768 RepID=UPI0015F05921|nr:hypothetical protein [Emticicia sp. BO119]MBA4849333.1 hypothetical protein [Emticicia sp. BO119]